MGDSRTPSLVVLGDSGPKNVLSFGEMDCVDRSPGESGLCACERFLGFGFVGCACGFVEASGCELASDFSFDMKDTMFAGSYVVVSTTRAICQFASSR